MQMVVPVQRSTRHKRPQARAEGRLRWNFLTRSEDDHLRYLLGVVVANDLELEQVDVQTTFLHRDLHENIYMSQPPGFTVTGGDHLVCGLKKCLYGHKQAS